MFLIFIYSVIPFLSVLHILLSILSPMWIPLALTGTSFLSRQYFISVCNALHFRQIYRVLSFLSFLLFFRLLFLIYFHFLFSLLSVLASWSLQFCAYYSHNFYQFCHLIVLKTYRFHHFFLSVIFYFINYHLPFLSAVFHLWVFSLCSVMFFNSFIHLLLLIILFS